MKVPKCSKCGKHPRMKRYRHCSKCESKRKAPYNKKNFTDVKTLTKEEKRLMDWVNAG